MPNCEDQKQDESEIQAQKHERCRSISLHGKEQKSLDPPPYGYPARPARIEETVCRKEKHLLLALLIASVEQQAQNGQPAEDEPTQVLSEERMVASILIDQDLEKDGEAKCQAPGDWN